MMVQFVAVACWKCGVETGMPAELRANRLKDGADFFCINGHAGHYGDCENDQLRRERDRLKQAEARLIGEAREANALAEKAQAARDRMRKRIMGGVCPDCKRSFPNMRRHMATKHGLRCAPGAAPKLRAV